MNTEKQHMYVSTVTKRNGQSNIRNLEMQSKVEVRHETIFHKHVNEMHRDG